MGAPPQLDPLDFVLVKVGRGVKCERRTRHSLIGAGIALDSETQSYIKANHAGVLEQFELMRRNF
jgi:hypothetical protein